MKPTIRFTSLRPLLLGLALVTAAQAHAQPTDLDALRKRFTQAIALEDKEEWAAAKKEFEEIGRVKMTAQVRFHIALCEKGLDRLATALAGFEAALELAEADAENNADVITNAREQIAELEPRVPKIALRVENDGVAHLTIDDGARVTARGRHAARVDPGPHTLTVEQPGKPPFVRKFNGEEGSLTEFTIPESKRVVAEVPVAPPPPPEDVTTVVPGDPVPAIVVGASGLALLVGAGVFLGLRQSTIGEIADGCEDPENLQGCDPGLQDAASRGEIWNGLTWSFGALGLAGVGVGAALFFTMGQDQTVVQKGPVSVSLGPTSVRFEVALQ